MRNRSLVVIALAALAIRMVAFPLFHSGGYTSDEKEYILLGTRVAQGEGFVDSNGEYSTRSPLFPLMLALLFVVFGENLIIPHIAGCLLGAAAVVLTHRVSVRLTGDEKVGSVSAIAMTLYPGLVIYSGLLQTEALYIVFMLTVFLCTYRFADGAGILNSLLLGLCAGLAALTRAVFIGFFPFLLVIAGWMRYGKHQDTPRHLVLACVAFCLTLLPWTLRNYEIHHAFVPVSSWSGKSLLIGNNPYATGTWRVKPDFEQWLAGEVQRRGRDNWRTLSEVEQSAISWSIAKDYILHHPLHTLQLALTKAHMFWIYPITNSDTYLPAQVAAVGADLVLLGGVAIGLLAMHRRNAILLYAAVAAFSCAHIVMHAEARYRLPLIPVLCIFFGWGLVLVQEKSRFRQFLARPGVKQGLTVMAVSILLVYCYTCWLFLGGKI